MSLFTTTFDPANPAHRTVPQWRMESIRPWDTTACLYALAHGEAKVFLADGRVKRFWHEDGKMRQQTYTHVIIVRD